MSNQYNRFNSSSGRPQGGSSNSNFNQIKQRLLSKVDQINSYKGSNFSAGQKSNQFNTPSNNSNTNNSNAQNNQNEQNYSSQEQNTNYQGNVDYTPASRGTASFASGSGNMPITHMSSGGNSGVSNELYDLKSNIAVLNERINNAAHNNQEVVIDRSSKDLEKEIFELKTSLAVLLERVANEQNQPQIYVDNTIEKNLRLVYDLRTAMAVLNEKVSSGKLRKQIIYR